MRGRLGSNNIFYICTIFNKINAKIYVGKTNDYENRWKRHIRIANGAASERTNAIHRAIRKYGVNNFIFKVVQSFEIEADCFAAERYWVEYFNSNDENFGYNLTNGGEGASGWKVTEEVRQKIRDKATGRKHTPETIEKLKQRKQSLPGRMPSNIEQLKIMNISRKHTEQAKANMSKARIGMKFTNEHRQNISKVMLGVYVGEKSPRYGKTHTEETKDKMRGEKCKRSKLKEYQVMEIIRKYELGEYSQSRLAQEYGVCREQIGKIVRRENWAHLKDIDGK